MNIIEIGAVFLNLDQISHVKQRENGSCVVFFGKDDLVTLTGEDAANLLRFLRKNAVEANA